VSARRERFCNNNMTGSRNPPDYSSIRMIISQRPLRETGDLAALAPCCGPMGWR
jgi:hypothetical protein